MPVRTCAITPGITRQWRGQNGGSVRRVAFSRRRLTALRVLVVIGLHEPDDARGAAEPGGSAVGVRLVRVEDERLVLPHELGAVFAQVWRAHVAVLNATCVPSEHRDDVGVVHSRRVLSSHALEHSAMPVRIEVVAERF